MVPVSQLNAVMRRIYESPEPIAVILGRRPDGRAWLRAVRADSQALQYIPGVTVGVYSQKPSRLRLRASLMEDLGAMEGYRKPAGAP